MLKSPVPYQTDAQYSNQPISERALLLAASQVGISEVPRGSNWGPMVKLYLKVVGLFGPAPWCAAFVTWCLVGAGFPRTKLPLNAASTFYWFDWARRNGLIQKTPPVRGLFILNDAKGGHIGFVAGLLSGYGRFRTIEGNTNDDGSREGYEVARRERSTDQLVGHDRWGFIDLKKLAEWAGVR